ncbi:hypothetical protein GN956_G3452 [Arapaima gigas]
MKVHGQRPACGRGAAPPRAKPRAQGTCGSNRTQNQADAKGRSRSLETWRGSVGLLKSRRSQVFLAVVWRTAFSQSLLSCLLVCAAPHRSNPSRTAHPAAHVAV